MNPLKFANTLFYWLVKYPLRTLYLKGFGLWEYGFWEGHSKQDICIKLLPDVPAKYWFNDTSKALFEEICDGIIDRKIQAFETGVLMIMYIYVSYRVVSSMIQFLACRLRRLHASPSRVPVLPKEPRLSVEAGNIQEEGQTTENA